MLPISHPQPEASSKVFAGVGFREHRAGQRRTRSPGGLGRWAQSRTASTAYPVGHSVSILASHSVKTHSPHKQEKAPSAPHCQRMIVNSAGHLSGTSVKAVATVGFSI